MTAEEKNQIANLAGEVAALKATVTNEFDHINNRLDSHSAQIKSVVADMGEVKQALAVHVAVNGYRTEHQEKEGEQQAEAVLQKRGKLYDAGLLVFGAVIGGGTGLFFNWLQGFVSCKPPTP